MLGLLQRTNDTNNLMDLSVIFRLPRIRGTHPAADCPATTRRALFRRLRVAPLLGVLGVLLPALTSAQTKEPQREPFQYSARDLEVRLDSLPDDIPAEQIEILLEASDIRCKPGYTKFLGMNITRMAEGSEPRFFRAGRPAMKQQHGRSRHSSALQPGRLVPIGHRRGWAGGGWAPARSAGRMPGIQMVLEPDEQAAHQVGLAKLCKGVTQRPVAQAQQG